MHSHLPSLGAKWGRGRGGQGRLEARDPVRGGQAPGPALLEPGSPSGHPVPGLPPCLPSPSAPPTPLPAPAPPPTNRERKFPGARSWLRAFSGLPAAEAGRGAGSRGGRQSEGAQDGARRGGWAAAAVSSVPAHRAAITARRRLPAGRHHRRGAGGGRPGAEGQGAHLPSREHGRAPGWNGAVRSGQGRRAGEPRERWNDRPPRPCFPGTPSGFLFRDHQTPPSCAGVSRVRVRRGPRATLVRSRKAERTLLRATAIGPSCPRALAVRWAGDWGPLSLGAADNNVLEKWFQLRISP